MSNLKERYSATLVGVAIGDTLGMPVETWPKARIERHYGRIIGPVKQKVLHDSFGNEIKHDEFGKIRYWARNLEVGSYTDDTILTLPLAESIIDNKRINIEDIAKRELHEYEIRIKPDGTVTGGFGGTTKLAYKNLQRGISPFESGAFGGPGNAPPMKMSPVGLFMNASNRYEEGLRDAELIGKITHRDPRSIAAGVIQAHAVYSLLNNIDRDNFVDSLLKVCRKYEKPVGAGCSLQERGNLLSRLVWINKNKDSSDKNAFCMLGNRSPVFESYPFTLFMFQKYFNNPLEGLLETVNWGGDCDTTGAMFGALVGARHGMIFPAEWTSVLKDFERLKGLGERLYEFGGKVE
jgi:ADP-ribosylglycohydrolase